MSIYFDDHALFKYFLTKLSIGQEIRISGSDQQGKLYEKESFIVRSVNAEEILTTTGLTFHYTKLTHISPSVIYHDPEELPHLNLTGELQNFDTEPE